ncbi:hypothetical protein [Xenorhabdus bovienii]|uniref:hypothetical protein n=1 Tax=Xenorhabdus bovienii TaxID=40576 RepID=UPI0023B2A546|nr:hypothetical protein [Xenorhabdus bovienii]MDE9466424.1 hypothetical protein [Xenorhabdus bovienii]MDE9487802.1 hypothetical protein [Xenorhabdus bovienii]
MTNSDECRKAFEEHLKKEGALNYDNHPILMRDLDGSYRYLFIHQQWEFWQIAWSANRENIESSVKHTLPVIIANRCDSWDKTLRALCDLSTSHELLSERLTEYENMEPVGHFYRCGDGFIGEVIDEYKNDDDVYPLYRHPKKELKFTAEIELTDFVHGADGKSIAFGYVFNDSRKRFEDGVEIVTSLVTNTETYKTDGYIKTQNSIYKIRE